MRREDDDGLKIIAQEVTGLLMTDCDMREAYGTLPDHSSTEYHIKLAAFINRHLKPTPDPLLTESDALAICELMTVDIQDFIDYLQTNIADLPKPNPLDGFHAQLHAVT